LFLEAKEAGRNTKEEEITEKSKSEMMKIFLKVIALSNEFNEKWERGKLCPTDEELNLLEKNVLKSETIRDEEYKEGNSSLDKKDIQLLREKAKEIKKKVEEEKTNRKNSPNDGYDKDKPNDKGGGNQPSPSSNNSELDKKIVSLRGKIQALEDKTKQIPASDNSDTS